MIVVAGEALIDLIPTADGGLRVSVGGGPFNTARWLARLGQPVGFLGAVSEDVLGSRIRESLAQAGVSPELLVSTPLPTTLALAQLDAAGAAHYSFYSERTSVADLDAGRAERALGLLPSAPRALHVGGLGLMLEPVATAVQAAVDLARERGALVMLDPNVRPSLIADRERYLTRLRRVLAQTHVLKLSIEDLAWIAPGEEPLGAARTLAAQGPAVVLLTRGDAGAAVVPSDSRDPIEIPAQAVEVVDTIGAGDAFNAGFLSHWLDGGHGIEAVADVGLLREAAHRAAAVAALACMQRGATPPALIAPR